MNLCQKDKNVGMAHFIDEESNPPRGYIIKWWH